MGREASPAAFGWKYLVFATTVVVFGCKSPERDLGRQLGGSEVRALFSGKTVKGHHEVHGYDFKSYYEPSGTFRSHQSDKPAARGAKWWVAGDDICIRWDDTPEDLCRRMFVDGAGVHRKVLLTGSEKRVVVTFESFVPGNAESL